MPHIRGLTRTNLGVSQSHCACNFGPLCQIVHVPLRHFVCQAIACHVLWWATVPHIRGLTRTDLEVSQCHCACISGPLCQIVHVPLRHYVCQAIACHGLNWATVPHIRGHCAACSWPLCQLLMGRCAIMYVGLLCQMVLVATAPAILGHQAVCFWATVPASQVHCASSMLASFGRQCASVLGAVLFAIWQLDLGLTWFV